MQADKGERLQIFQNKIAVTGGVDGVGGGRGETQLARGDSAVERERCAGHRAGAERTEVETRRAIAEARRIA